MERAPVVILIPGKGKRDLKIWPGSAHGVDIAEDEEASSFVIKWLKANL
jgi:hypothetical protein